MWIYEERYSRDSEETRQTFKCNVLVGEASDMLQPHVRNRKALLLSNRVDEACKHKSAWHVVSTEEVEGKEHEG
jgi:hypothetical protein